MRWSLVDRHVWETTQIWPFLLVCEWVLHNCGMTCADDCPRFLDHVSATRHCLVLNLQYRRKLEIDFLRLHRCYEVRLIGWHPLLE